MKEQELRIGNLIYNKEFKSFVIVCGINCEIVQFRHNGATFY